MPETSASRVRGTLQQVTAGVTTTNQTVVQLGTFDGPATGGWGVNRLVPLMNGTAVASVPLSGVQTIRFTTDSGDYDFLAFVPAGAPPLQFNAPTFSSGTLSISWSGTAILQQASALTGSPGDWSDVNPQPTGSSYTVDVTTGGSRYYRLKQGP